ncbi:uncharacterized protein EI97DRAFT_223751 [Westerdykella ornata]|uniref:Myb-like domain-containing protein n=1 Tax=Westerdykella ornata TaxID=318751 RepID=A0A6A6JQL6_WESOR|nr:uncharacterized protein EI97DRAFT_223751 [Westerdykella ornata]KAF2278940.1 hypothetical protein EI97DRAFT_223751 [Westerdykella ornata]
MLHHQPQVLSPLPEMNSQSSDASLRARKMSAGGNRSWSEEEENYLLQTRMQKMPYKHIAAHLKKTELACRLHFHQLSHGSHRLDRDDYSSSSRHGSPLSYTGGSPHIRAASITASPGRNQHKILLPKPRPLSPRDSPEPFNALRINTEVAHQPKVVDTDRLRAIYEAHRQQFWAAVAADYGADVSPAQLEEIWRSGSYTVRPPTPDASPDGSIMQNPVLKPSHYTYASPVSETGRHFCSPLSNSAVSAPATDRMSYVLPMPVPRPRSGTWSSAPRDNVPIASLLNEDKK